MGLERTKPSTTAIIVVDVQEKLVSTMAEAQMAALLRAARILLGAAAELGAPVIATEQYPQGLGPTIAPIREQLERLSVKPIDKLAFSGCNEPSFVDAIKATRCDCAVVIGMETHICVFQTVRDLVARGVRVDVPIDGVASRKEDHRAVGLELCTRAGAVVTTAETVLFDWLVQSGTDTFRKLAKLVR
jgi:nicotinamidase-related amidase